MAQGFRTAIVREIRVDAEAAATVDVALEIGLADMVVVTASKFDEEVINAPATATVIPEQTIRELPSQNLAELLRAVPGMNVVQTSAAQTGVVSRAAGGAMPGTQLVLIDGRTIYQDFVGYASWELVPTGFDEVKQMEVIRGPASAVWGAYAMNGVINIITKPPREMLGTTLTLGAGTFNRSGGAAESNTGSLYYVNAAHAQALNDRWSFKVTAGAYTQDAFARPQGAIPNPFHTPYPTFPNKGTTRPKADARVDYDLPDGKQRLTFAGGYVSADGIVPGAAGGLEGRSSSNYGKVNYARGDLKITAYANIYALKGKFLLVPGLDRQPILQRSKAQTYHFEFDDSRMVPAKHLINYGGSFRHLEVNSSIMPGAKPRNEGGAYFQDEILISEHFRWIAGARIDKFNFLKGVVLSPRTTFMVKPAPGQTFRLSYNRAYVAPSVFMTYMRMFFLSGFDLGLIDPQFAGNYFTFPMCFCANTDVKEQSLNAYEVGYTASVTKGRASLGAAFYVNDSKQDFGWRQIASYTSQNPPPGWPLPPFVLDALIAANAFGPGMGLPSVSSTYNLGKVRNKGLELNADVRFNRWLAGYANYSWQAKPTGKESEIALVNLPPAHRFNAGLSFDYKRYLGNISVGYTGSAYWRDVLSALYNGPTKAFTVVNVSAGVRWGRGGRYMAMLKVSDLANTRVQNHVYGDILKRQITGELRVRF
jgi:outer membrane receptor protein involved in Fe transport